MKSGSGSTTRITLVDTLNDRRLRVTLPDDVPLAQLLPALARKLGLPEGEYVLKVEGQAAHLAGGKTLAQSRVGEGDMLCLECVPKPEPVEELMPVRDDPKIAPTNTVITHRTQPRKWGNARVFAVIVALIVVIIIGLWLSGQNEQQVKTSMQTEQAMPMRIAFESDRDGNDEIYIVNFDGSGLTNVSNRLESDSSPTWSPGGNRIAFIGWEGESVHLLVTNIDSLTTTSILHYPPQPFDPVWSPDGQFIAFTGWHGDMDIYIVRPDGSELSNLSNNSEVHDAFEEDFSQFVWSPDSQRILFMSNREPHGLFVISRNGSNMTPLTPDPRTAGRYFSWSPDGQHIIFNYAQNENWEIFIMNADGSEQVNISNHPANDYSPVWAPDCNHVAYYSNRDGNSEIYVMNADGSGQTNLTNDPATDKDPKWSEDGSYIAFESNRDGNWEIYIMNADGSGLMNLTNNPADDRNPVWSPMP